MPEKKSRPRSEAENNRDYLTDSGLPSNDGPKIAHSRREENCEETYNPCVIKTANGMLEAQEEANVYICDLDIFLCVTLVDDPPAV